MSPLKIISPICVCFFFLSVVISQIHAMNIQTENHRLVFSILFSLIFMHSVCDQFFIHSLCANFQFFDFFFALVCFSLSCACNTDRQ